MAETFLTILSNNIAPIFIVMGVGFLIERAMSLDVMPISRLIFYVFAPALVFDSLVKSPLGGGDIVRMFVFTVVVALITAGAARLVAGVAGLDNVATRAIVLTSLLANTANYGMSLVGFAFGDEALSHAVICYIASMSMSYTLGIYIASGGKGGEDGGRLGTLKGALVEILRLPALYALIAGMVVGGQGWEVPQMLSRPIELLSRASIPAMLVMLGMRLALVRDFGRSKIAFIVAGMRLVLSPAIALLLSPIAALKGAALQAGVIESAMPTAVVTSIIATEYELDPDLVTQIILISTLLSPITLTLLVAYLQ